MSRCSIVYNRTLLDFAGHYRFHPKACRPYRAKTKGKVERPFRYVRQDFFLGRTFRHLICESSAHSTTGAELHQRQHNNQRAVSLTVRYRSRRTVREQRVVAPSREAAAARPRSRRPRSPLCQALDEDRETYTADTAGLLGFLEGEILPQLAKRRKELSNRPLIREQALGEALDPAKLERLGRYEVHLDRKLERMLAMLLRLKELRRTTETK